VGRAETLSGVVVDSAGMPVSGARVTAAAIFHSPPLRVMTTTDERGAFSVELPPVSGDTKFFLVARWQNQGAIVEDALDSAGKKVAIAGQKLPTVSIRLQPGGRLRGRLLRAEDDGPIAGGRVFLDTGEVLSVDEHGAFEVDGLAQSDHSLIPVTKGRVRPYVLFDTTLEPDARLDVRLPRGAVIKGRVTDSKGESVLGAYISRASSGQSFTLSGWCEPCAADGSFEYSGLSTGRLFYGLHANSLGYQPVDLPSEVDDPAVVIQHDVQLKPAIERPQSKLLASVTLDSDPSSTKVADEPVGTAGTTAVPSREIRGKVTGPDDQAVADAVVRHGAYPWDQSVKPTKTNAQGEYELVGLPGATGAILIIAEGLAPKFVPYVAGDTRLDVKLTRGASARGIVRSTSGAPVEGVQVIPLARCVETGFCNPTWFHERTVKTSADGRFQIEALPEGPLQFDLVKAAFTDQRNQTLSLGDAENEIEMTSGGALRGLVVDDAGNPVRQFNIRVLIPRQRREYEQAGGCYAGFDWYGVNFTRDNGVFVLSDVGAKHWLRIIVRSPGVGRAVLDRVQTQSLDTLEPAEKLTIVLAPYRPLNVKVLDAVSNEPIAGALVGLLEDQPELGQRFSWGYDDLYAERTRSDATGVARFAEPNCQDGAVMVLATGYAREHVAWIDNTDELVVRMRRGATVRGEVRLDGKLLAGGYVRLTTRGNESMTDDLEAGAGRFDFDQLPEGEATLVVTPGTGADPVIRKIKLTAGGTHSERIDLPPVAAVPAKPGG